MRYRILYFIVGLICLAGYAEAQGNVDSVFTNAIGLSRSGKFNDAIKEAGKALKMDSLRGDIYVFTANVYSWKEHNDTAMIYLNKARKVNYQNDEFYQTALNVLLRAQKNDSLLALCKEAQKNGYRDSLDIVKKQTLAMENRMDYYGIVTLYKDTINKKMLTDSVLYAIHKRAKSELLHQIISADYSLDVFGTGQVHQYASIAYTNKYNRLTTSLALNYANRYGLHDAQFDYTGYKQLKSKDYWFLNYAFAFNGKLFAKHRAGLEYFFKTKKGAEVSLGGRYMFYPFATDKDIWIATASMGLYIKNSWLSVRPYYVVRNSQSSLSFITKYRIYKTNPLEFTSLEMGFGNSPDDIYTSTSGSFNKLMSYRFRVEKSKLYGKKNQLLLAATIINEQYSIGPAISSRFRFVFDVGYRYHF